MARLHPHPACNARHHEVEVAPGRLGSPGLGPRPKRRLLPASHRREGTLLTDEQIRRWFRSVTKRGQREHIARAPEEFATNAFFRAVGVNHRNFYLFLRGKPTINKHHKLNISRFAAEWEAGKIAFTMKFVGTPTGRRELIRLQTPRPRRTRFAVAIGPGGPKMLMLDRLPERPRMPDMRELIVSKS